MVIAAGPRIINSTMGPIPLSTGGLDGYQQAQQLGQLSFTVTFDRPINPPGAIASFTAADVQVFYHDTTYGDPSIPLQVLSVVPVVSSGVGTGQQVRLHRVHGHLQRHDQARRGLQRHRELHRHLQLPDHAGRRERQPDRVADRVVCHHRCSASRSSARWLRPRCPCGSPTSGTGGTGTSDDVTTSTSPSAGFNNQIITGVTVNLSLTHQNASDLVITLTAPDGQTAMVFQGDQPPARSRSNNQAFAVNGLDGGLVDGTYTLTIDDTAANNTGTLTGWSVTVDSTLPTFVFQNGAPDDQNADGTADENPLTMPDGYTGLTPGDVYAVPTPQLDGADHVHHGPEHPQPAVRSEHPAADRRPARRSSRRRPSAPRGSVQHAATTCCSTARPASST